VLEDGFAEAWTPKALQGVIVQMMEKVAANHGRPPLTDYDRALGRRQCIEQIRAVAKDAAVVDLNGVQNTVMLQWANDIGELVGEMVQKGLIEKDEGMPVLRAAATLAYKLESTTALDGLK
jgi:hypothetical protein